MRIFLPSNPAGRLEYLLMMVVTTIAGYVATNFYLQLAVDVDTRELSYIARNLPTFSLILAVILAIQIIASMRRLNDLGKPTGAAFLVLLPLIGTLFTIWLAVTKRPKTFGYAPYGDNPLDPQSWVDDRQQAA